MKEEMQRLHAQSWGLYTQFRIDVDSAFLNHKAKSTDLALNETCNSLVKTSLTLVVFQSEHITYSSPK